MNPQQLSIAAAVAILLVTIVLMVITMSRFAKVGPNQVMIVSGRKIQLPDGRTVGVRIVKSGGTFVIPVIEKADVMSLEVVPVEMLWSKAQAADGRGVEANWVAQVKIKSDVTSVMAAAEYFLAKGPAEIKSIVLPVLEKHLVSVLAGSKAQEILQNPAACAARTQTAAASDLGNMGLGLVSFTIRNVRLA